MPFFWVPEEPLDLRVRRDHVPYDVWEKQGYLQTTEGNVLHYGFIEKFIEELGCRYNIREIAYDRWGATEISQRIDGAVATIMALDRAIRCGLDTGESVYDSRGLIVF